jgi:hypothetical protein
MKLTSWLRQSLLPSEPGSARVETSGELLPRRDRPEFLYDGE